MATAEVKAQQPEMAKEKCTSDPNFAVICAFIKRFGTICGVLCPSIGRLQVSENFVKLDVHCIIVLNSFHVIF